ncbi:unnamed protein product, partial [Brenthis ino]
MRGRRVNYHLKEVRQVEQIHGFVKLQNDLSPATLHSEMMIPDDEVMVRDCDSSGSAELATLCSSQLQVGDSDNCSPVSFSKNNEARQTRIAANKARDRIKRCF